MVFSTRWLALTGLCACLAMPVCALDFKDLDKSVFDRLSAKASEKVTVTLDGDTLRLASKFLSGGGDDARLRRLVEGLRSVSVRSFEFKKEGDYSRADLEAIRGMINQAEWSRIVDVESKEDNEHTEVYLLPGKGKAQGVFIIAAEAMQLTVVEVVGQIDLADLAELQEIGVPDLSGKLKSGKENK